MSKATEIADVETPILTGKFALFNTPDGGMHLTYRPDGAENDEHIEVPGLLVKMAKKYKGNPMAMLGGH